MHRSQVIRLLRQLVLGLAGLAACLGSFPLPVQAQTQFGWQLQGGSALPLSAYVRNGVRVEAAGLNESGEEQFDTYLVDQYNQFGFQAGTLLLFNQYEVRYAFNYLGWNEARTICAGSSPAVVLPTGDIDDSTVVYDCSDDQSRGVSDVRDAGLNPVNLHVLSVGYRFYFLPMGETFEPFFVVAPGLCLSTYTDREPDAGLVLGFHLNGGLGADIGLSEAFTVALQVRYNLLLNPPPTRVQSAANRAVARGDSAWDALVESFHYLTFDLGIRVNFR